MYGIRERIASFDIDAQKGFTPLCPDELPVEDGHNIAEELNENAKFASIRICSKDAHPNRALWNADEEHPPLTECFGEENVDMYWPKHCVAGTKGFELIDGLPNVDEYDMVVFKGCEPNIHPYGACFHDLSEKISTGVIEFLGQKGVDIVIVGGLAFDFCVRTTVNQLLDNNFTVIINMASTRSVSPEDDDAIEKEMMESGVIFVEDSKQLNFLIRAMNVIYSW